MSVDLREIVQRIGGQILQGGRAALVPGPGHSRRDRSLSLKLSHDGKLLWHSFAGDQPRAVMQHLGIAASQERVGDTEAQRRCQERERADNEQQALKLAFCNKVWRESVDIMGTPGETYLNSRGITGQLSPALRYHLAAPLGYDTAAITHPAVVALVRDARGKACGLHVTAIKADGTGKALVPNPRRMFGEIHGHAVQLLPVDHDNALAVAEGIETALSFEALAGVPTWAALSATGLKGFEPPPGVTHLIIAADGDKAGIQAACALGDRFKSKMAVLIAIAGHDLDWNDELLFPVSTFETVWGFRLEEGFGLVAVT
jgi:putative DNA primase/helicase